MMSPITSNRLIPNRLKKDNLKIKKIGNRVSKI